MLKKRTRSVHQDQPKTYSFMSVSDFILRNGFRNQKARKNSVFNVPGLFVGLGWLFEGDAAKTPTSTLDHRVFSSEGCPFRDQKCWDCSKVGLSIIDDTGEKDELCTKNIIFGPQMKIQCSTSGNNFHDYIASKSLPKNYPVFRRSKVKSPASEASSSRCIFEIGDEAHDPTEPQLVEVFRSCSLDSSSRHFIHMPKYVHKSYLGSSLIDQKLCSRNVANSQFQPAPIAGGLKPGAGSVSQFCSDADGDASKFVSSADIELSEDYTYVLTHEPNPKTTHIYSDCTSGNEHCDYVLHPSTKYCDTPALFPSKDFLSACYKCGKNLDGGDIFMYRGEKAFCSLECRESEIVNNEDSDDTESALSDEKGSALYSPES